MRYLDVVKNIIGDEINFVFVKHVPATAKKDAKVFVAFDLNDVQKLKERLFAHRAALEKESLAKAWDFALDWKYGDHIFSFMHRSTQYQLVSTMPEFMVEPHLNKLRITLK